MDVTMYEKFEALDQSQLRQRLNIARSNGEFVDVCLRVEGSAKFFKAHQVVLAAASDILKIEDKSEIKGVTEADLEDILIYIYVGKVQVPRNRLESFLEAAKSLGVIDLQDVDNNFEEATGEDPKFEISEVRSVNNSADQLAKVPLGSKDKTLTGETQKTSGTESFGHSEENPILKDKEFELEEDAVLIIKQEFATNLSEVGQDDADKMVARDNEPLPQKEKRPINNKTKSKEKHGNILNDMTLSFSCHTCKKTFEDKQKLKRHEKIHSVTKQKLFPCNFGEKAFIYPSDLHRHEITHTGEKTYKCSFCAKTFSRMGRMKEHERTHTGEKPYECSFCDKAFSQGGHLKDHEKIHTGERPYQCNFCEKAFRKRSVLKEHERIHTGDKSYKCSFCDKAFCQGGQRKKHERSHTGEKPYVCSICKKSFTTSSHMKGHKRTHKE